MELLSFTDFRKSMANSFDRVDAGEKVFVSRGSKKMYAIIPVTDDDLMVSPSLEAKIAKARQEYSEGKTVVLKSHDDIDKYFDSL